MTSPTVPTLPKTYQTIRWTDDADPNFVDTASDLESLEQDVLHILMQVLGSNLDDPNRGVHAEGYLGATNLKIGELPHLLDSQLESDSRISSSQTTLTQTSANPVTFMVQCTVVVAGQVVKLNYKVGPGGVSKA